MITALVLAATPTPTGTASGTASTTPKVDADLVTPGLSGFVMLFVLAVAVYFLGRSMARRIRRVNHRARLEEQERAAAAAGASAPAPSDGRDRPAQD
ncbi:hypothetical protein AB1207_18925 [Kineococcus endophyticus]|uniref:Uncharacterized protein n=1 Tax=Kineococcus endophyticus TaxID=1181883 RepID=A0ABV3PBT4_9ACTN